MSNQLTTRRGPFADFDALMRAAFGPTSLTPSNTGFSPAAEIVREGDDAVVRLELPGVDVANDVAVEIDGRHLVVRGERRDERSEDKDGRSLREIRYGRFARSFRLPERVDAASVAASYDAGVLSVRVSGAYASTAATRIAISTEPVKSDEQDA